MHTPKENDATKTRLEKWAHERVERGSARWWLYSLAFVEGAFFPIPPDILLITIFSLDTRRWVEYVIYTTIFSVLGGLLGYAIGALFFSLFGEAIIAFYHLESTFAVIQDTFNKSAFISVSLSAFTPVPYKVFAIAAGLTKANIIVFIIASLLGRGARFLLLGYIMSRFGEKIGKLLFRSFNIFLIVLILGVIALVGIQFLY